MGAQIISVANQKGGTGKTTTTLNLGCALARLGKKVLLIDLDPQANLSYSLGISNPAHTIADVITNKKPLASTTVKVEKLDLLPGSTDMADIEMSMASHENRAYFIKEMLDGETGKYDFILIDSPPSLSLLTINALTAATGVLIPMQLEVLTLQGLNQILNTIERIKNTLNPDLEVKGILLVMYDKRRKLTEELQAVLAENIENRIYNSQIRLNVKIAEAPSFGQPVISYDPESHGAKDYMAFAREFSKETKKVKQLKPTI